MAWENPRAFRNIYFAKTSFHVFFHLGGNGIWQLQEVPNFPDSTTEA